MWGFSRVKETNGGTVGQCNWATIKNEKERLLFIRNWNDVTMNFKSTYKPYNVSMMYEKRTYNFIVSDFFSQEMYGKKNNNPPHLWRCQYPMPGICNYVTIHGKRDFAAMIRLRTLRWKIGSILKGERWQKENELERYNVRRTRPAISLKMQEGAVSQGIQRTLEAGNSLQLIANKKAQVLDLQLQGTEFWKKKKKGGNRPPPNL